MTHKKDIYTNRTRAKLLGSENDLNEYFASTSVGNEKTKVIVFKERDDIITREFNAFCMMSDDTCTYETNTIPYVRIPPSQDGTTLVKILPYMPIRYEERHSSTPVNEEHFLTVGKVIDETNPIQDIKECLLDRNEFIYFSPFSYYVDNSGDTVHTYVFDEHVDETYSVYIKTLTSESVDTPIVNYVKAKRNPALGELINVYAYVTEGELARNRYFLMVKDSDDKLVAIEMQRNEDEGCFECAIPTDELGSIQSDEKYTMSVKSKGLNQFYSTYDSNGKWSALENVTFLSNAEAFIYCMEPIDENNLIDDNKGEYKELSAINSSSEAPRGLNEYRLKSISTINGGFKFFENLNDVVTIGTTVQDSARCLYMLPVVGGRMLFSNSVYDSFMTLFKSVIEAIRNAAKRLHNNTRLNIKFFNTYGRTNFWGAQLLKTSEDSATEVQKFYKPNLYYEIVVDRQNGYDEEVEKKISTIVRDWTEQLFNLVYNNVLITERISLSNLLKELENQITDCDSINIKSINGIDHVKYIVPDPDYKTLLDSEQSNTGFVPSFPTVNLGVLNESRSLKKENDIFIQFVS